MMQWNNDYWADALKTGPAIMWPQASNPWVNWYIDRCTWWFLQMWFAKYRIPEQAGEVEKFIGSFSLNGFKSNVCKPN